MTDIEALTPAELRAAAERLERRVTDARLAQGRTADPTVPADVSANDAALGAAAARRLADVIEYADRHAAFPPRGPLQGAVAWENIRRLASGEADA